MRLPGSKCKDPKGLALDNTMADYVRVMISIAAQRRVVRAIAPAALCFGAIVWLGEP